MKLLYVRHGKTVGNTEGNYIGRSESLLTDQGREQARLAGQSLVETGQTIDAIYTSGLSRAYDTAVIIAREIGFNEEDIVKSDLLLERAGGEYEGKPQSEFFAIDEAAQVALGAESFKALSERALAMVALAELENPNGVVLFVGSAAIGEMMRAMIRHNDQSKMFDDGPLPNAQILQFK